MQNKKNANQLFIEACTKAGLKVQSNPGHKAAYGLVVVDSRGCRYIVSPDARLRKAESNFVSRIKGKRGPVKSVAVERTPNCRNGANGRVVAKRIAYFKKQTD